MSTLDDARQTIKDSLKAGTEKAEHAAEAAADKAAPGDADHEDVLEAVARAGYAAKGVTYLLVGVLAVMAAFQGFSADGSRGTLASVAQMPGGRWLVGALGLGLALYALWQFSRLFIDPEDEGDDGSGVAKRIFLGGSGVIHTSLAIYAFGAAFTGTNERAGQGDGGGTQGLVQMALGWPMGWLLVLLAGLGVLGFGLYQLYKAYQVKLTSKLALEHMSEAMRKFTMAVGRLGLGARGVVFSMVGAFVTYAGLRGRSSEAGGSDSALETLGDFGSWALIPVAVGLACYGLYMLVKARYRRVAGEHPDE